MSNYITEAFKQLNLLEDANDVMLDASGIEELRSFLDDAAVDPDEEMPMDIFDLEAEAQEDLKKSYEGKVILECTVCHSHIFEDKDNISMDDGGLACPELECPYCMSNEGYYILGEVAPFDQEKADEFAAEAEGEDLPDVDIEGAVDDIDEEDLDEAYDPNGKGKGTAYDPNGKSDGDAYRVDEEFKLDGVEELYDNDEIRGVEELEGVDELEGVKELHGEKHEAPINEDIEDVSVTTEDETMTMTTKDDGGVVIETVPKEADMRFDAEVEVEEPSDEEMIVPIDDESSDIIDASIDALDDEDEEEFDTLKDETEEAPEEEFEDIEEFDEEAFDNLGESYLRNCYENVKSFKTSKVSSKGNKLFIEGVIGFDSGNSKKTNFIFEAVKTSDGNYKLEGYNKQISRGKKTFKLSGSVSNKKFISETLNYNYRSKNELNESVRVYGTIRKK